MKYIWNFCLSVVDKFMLFHEIFKTIHTVLDKIQAPMTYAFNRQAETRGSNLWSRPVTGENTHIICDLLKCRLTRVPDT